MTARTATLALLVGTLLGAVGCAHRVTLDRTRFSAEISATNANANNIRVYLDHRLKVTYKLPRRGDTFVDHDIHLTGRRNVLHHIIRRRTGGSLVAIESRGDRPLLYVTFNDCRDKRCAFGFLADATNRHFTLVEVPDIAPAVKTIRARDRARLRTLTRGFLHHLSEPAQVYRAARPRRGPLTVDLEVFEHAKPKRVRWRWYRGPGDDQPARDLVSHTPPPPPPAPKD